TNWQGHNSAAAKAKQESNALKQKKSQPHSQKSGATPANHIRPENAHQETQGLNNPSSKSKTSQTQSGESEGLNSPRQGLNNPPQGLNNPPQGLNNLAKGLNNPSQSSKSASDKKPEASQTIQTYSDFIKTLSDSERESFFEFVEEKTKHFPNPIMDLEAWLAKDNSASRNRWEIYYQRFVKAQTKIPPKQNRPLRDEIERQRLEAIEHLRKEAELKAAQGIEETLSAFDNWGEEI
ncbi:MAG: hypothetical protein WBM32_07675, partial [Crocosphaera sp.]